MGNSPHFAPNAAGQAVNRCSSLSGVQVGKEMCDVRGVFDSAAIVSIMHRCRRYGTQGSMLNRSDSGMVSKTGLSWLWRDRVAALQKQRVDGQLTM